MSRFWREIKPAVCSILRRQETINQFFDIQSFSERRQRDTESPNPKEQILPERVPFQQQRNIAMSGGNKTEINRRRATAANARHCAFLQDTQQTSLHVERHVADFIKKQRTLVGAFDFATSPSAASTGE